VNKALSYVFAKDRDFQDYLKFSDARRITPTLRIRRTAIPWGTQKQARNKAVSRGGVNRVSEGRKVMTGTQMQWRNERGAPHRLYLDTPPLKGWRLLPTGSDCYRAGNQQITQSAIANAINRYRDFETFRRLTR
jgi:hypothetical protein